MIQQNSEFLNQQRVLNMTVLACLLFCGCGDPQRSKLYGTWGIETADNLWQRLGETEIAGTSADQPMMSRPRMQIQFRSDGELLTITEMGRMTPAPKQGSWELVAYDSATKQMKIKCTIGLQITEHEIQFIDDDRIELVPPNLAGLSMKLKFKRIVD